MKIKTGHHSTLLIDPFLPSLVPGRTITSESERSKTGREGRYMQVRDTGRTGGLNGKTGTRTRRDEIDDNHHPLLPTHRTTTSPGD